MTTPTGTISISQIQSEISDTGDLDMNYYKVRTLSGTSTNSQVSISQMRGKSYNTPPPPPPPPPPWPPTQYIP